MLEFFLKMTEMSFGCFVKNIIFILTKKIEVSY